MRFLILSILLLVLTLLHKINGYYFKDLKVVSHRELLQQKPKSDNTMIVAMKSWNYKRLVTYDETRNQLVLLPPEKTVRDSQLFCMTFMDDGTVAMQELQTDTQKYICIAPQNDFILQTNSTRITRNELFTIRTFGKDFISLNSLSNSRYVGSISATSPLAAVSLSPVFDIYTLYRV